jgi:hypothetical protein
MPACGLLLHSLLEGVEHRNDVLHLGPVNRLRGPAPQRSEHTKLAALIHCSGKHLRPLETVDQSRRIELELDPLLEALMKIAAKDKADAERGKEAKGLK